MGLLNSNITARVRAQYERYPYPHVPWWKLLFLPGTKQLERLAVPNARTILVAGCGTLQATLVARANPQSQIVALDLSETALRKAQRIAKFCGVGQAIRFEQGDLHELTYPDASFDYLVCTGVLHHCEKPQSALSDLARVLADQGTLRLMTYAPKSRSQIYQLQRLVKGLNLSEAKRTLDSLSRTHQLRYAYRSYSDARTKAGFVDGFLHAHDQPIAYSDFEKWCSSLGLEVLRVDLPPGESLTELARALGIDQQTFSNYSTWKQLEIVDNLSGFRMNPTLVLKKIRA